MSDHDAPRLDFGFVENMVQRLLDAYHPPQVKPDKIRNKRMTREQKAAADLTAARERKYYAETKLDGIRHWMAEAAEAIRQGDAERAAVAAFIAGGDYERLACVSNFGADPENLGVRLMEQSRRNSGNRRGKSQIPPELLAEMQRRIDEGVAPTAAAKALEVDESRASGIGWQAIYLAWKAKPDL